MMVRSVPSAEVVKAIRSLVNSVLGHFGPLKKTEVTEDRSDQGPKWTPRSLLKTRAIPARPGGVFTTRRYTNSRLGLHLSLPYPPLLRVGMWA